MATDGDRDRAVDRLLRTSLGDALAASSSDCLDPERLAAWADGALSPSAIRSVERHLAGCARCQSMAAALARMDPASPHVTTPRLWSVTWLMPFAAVAAAAALWFFVPHGESRAPVVAEPERQMAQLEAPSPTVAPSVEMADRKQASGPAEKGSTLQQERRDSIDGLGDSRARAGTAAAGSAGAMSRNMPASPSVPSAPGVDAERQPGRLLPLPAEHLPSNSKAPSSLDAASNVGATQSAGSKGGTPSSNMMIDGVAPIGERPLVQAQSGERSFQLSDSIGLLETSRRAVVVSEFTAPLSLQGFAGGAGRAANGGPAAAVPRAPATAPIAAPPIRWRVLADGRIQRSSTNGASWDAVAIDVPVRAGSAPTPDVCWLAGPRGVVLRSTDAQHFERISFPEAVDLIAVAALDAGRATVTTADGRQFMTSDRGLSWQLVSR